jgi:lipoprotein-anchoring transpeptidase ErfK/SrfK
MGDESLLKRLIFCSILAAFLLFIPGSDRAGASVQIIDNTDYPTLYLAQVPLQGEAVWLVQARLKEMGYDIEPNGVFDKTTSNTISMFQLSVGMKADGIVNEAVWQALLASEEGDSLCAADEQGEKGRMLIVIDVAHRTLVLYEDDKEVCRYPVAVGKAKTPTPLGEWKVIHKGMGWGNGFGTRWMGLNVPWGIYGIHGTNEPGSIGTYASHGCIRMFNRDVEKLYPLVPWGCRVKIVNDGKMVPEQIKPVELKKKSSGQRVVYVQSRLKELGVEFDGADGRFGNMTELAVKYFQVWHGLEPSGIVDEATYRALGLIE